MTGPCSFLGTNRFLSLGAVGLIFLTLSVVDAEADSTGALTPTGVSQVSPAGSATWTLSANAIATPGAYATSGPTNVTSQLAFSVDPSGIPAGSTIDGLEATVEGYRAGGTIPVFLARMSTDSGATLSFAPSPSMVAAAAGPPNAVATFGSPTDTWTGVTLADLNAPGFVLSVMGLDFLGAATFSVDAVQLTVYYTPPAPPPGPLPLASRWTLVLTAIALVSAALFATIRHNLVFLARS